jgi:hypothetical protein
MSSCSFDEDASTHVESSFYVDWNPAVDKQAAARCWRDGQNKRCFTYRFLATGTVEEKIFQRQLSKEGLQSVVDDKQQVNSLSKKDLSNLFKLRSGTPSDTHDKLRCERCKIIHDDAEVEALKVLPKQLAACLELVDEMTKHEDASHFHKPLVSQDYGVSKEAYEKVVKQPMDLGTVRNRLGMTQDQPSAYKSVSSVSKDVNRIFSNVIKVWAPGDPIADASRRLQSWWIEKWTDLVPRLMVMKATSEGDFPGDSNLDSETAAFAGCATLNNERGDDYQGQIGMPDEENMRHWSHHHTTDTVDDPVFRAAMRGSDAVSFVFGLEVTWSLIQQRQQEEEERQAMEELEGMEELPKAKEDADDEDGNDEDSEGEDVDGDDQMDDSSSSDDEEEGQVENEPKNDDSNGAHSNNADQELTDSDTSDDSLMAASVPLAPQLDANPSLTGETSSTQTEVELLTGCSTPDSNKENDKASPSKNEWECPTCTLFNRKAKKKCIACGTAPPKKRSIDEVEYGTE